MKTIYTVLLCCLFVGCTNNNVAKEKKEDISVLTDGKTACLLSQISYCSNEQQLINQYMEGWNVVWRSAALGGNHVFIARHNNAYALAIRGSLIEFSWDAFQNWIYQDLNIASLEKWNYTNDSSKARVATGSWRGWQNLQQLKDAQSGATLLSFLEKNIKENTPLLITGHSLGGNLATVYASYLWQYFTNKGRRTKINVITFAAPAAGNASFAKDFDKKFPLAIRYENGNDIVPKFPCRSRVSGLCTLNKADSVIVGYKDVSVPLSKVFTVLNSALLMMEIMNGNAEYTQTSGEGTAVTVVPSGKNTGNDIASWLGEAGYNHGIASYALGLNVPVVKCVP